jgi:DNA repair exonuclease SbcCD ATPase subunit
MEYKDMPVDKLLWNTRMYPGCVSASESAAELGRRLADAQAQIEALRAQVKELEQWVQDQSTANLETMRHMDEMQSRAMDAEYQLTRRTAELEAIETILDIDSGKTTVEKVRDLHHSFKQVWESYQDASNEMFKVQAELERVRADNKALDEWRADVTVSLQRPGGAFFVDVPQHIKDLVKERDDLRTLIAANKETKHDAI